MKKILISGGIVVALSLAVCFARLGTAPIQKWDEGIHGSVSLEFWQGNDWALTYHQQPYFAKPPLRFWLTAPIVEQFGATEVSMRFWSAVAGVATAMLLWWWAFQATKTAWVGVSTAIVFLLGRFIFFHSFRTGETDGILVFLMTGAMYAYWRWWERRVWWIGIGLCIGLTFLTKPMFGVFPFAIIGLDLLMSRALSRERIIDMVQAFGVSLLVAAPWHIAMTMRFGQAFWDSFVGFNVLQRAGDTLYKNHVPWWWYGKVIAMRFFPFVTLLPMALLTTLKSMVRAGRSIERLLFIWAAVIFTAFSLIQTKFDWYVLPLYPALALMIGVAMRTWWQQQRRSMIVGVLVALGIVWYVAESQVDLSGPIRFITPFGYLPSGVPKIISALGVPLIGIAVLWKKNPLRYAQSIGLLAVLAITGIAGWYSFSELRHLPTTSGAKEIAAVLREKNISSVDLVGFDARSYPNLYFYLRQRPELQINEGLPSVRPHQTTITLAGDQGGEVFGEFRLLAQP